MRCILSLCQARVLGSSTSQLTSLYYRQDRAFKMTFSLSLSAKSFCVPCPQTSLMVEGEEVDFSWGLTYPAACSKNK